MFKYFFYYIYIYNAVTYICVYFSICNMVDSRITFPALIYNFYAQHVHANIFVHMRPKSDHALCCLLVRASFWRFGQLNDSLNLASGYNWNTWPCYMKLIISRILIFVIQKMSLLSPELTSQHIVKLTQKLLDAIVASDWNTYQVLQSCVFQTSNIS